MQKNFPLEWFLCKNTVSANEKSWHLGPYCPETQKKKKGSNATTPLSMQECKAVGPNTSSMVAKDWAYNVNLYAAI